MSASMDESLDLLEQKVLGLERTVLGGGCVPGEGFHPVVDTLVQANTLLTATLSGKQRLEAVMRRLDELHRSLDTPGAGDTLQSVEAKADCILAVGEALRDPLVAMAEIQPLMEILNDDAMRETVALKEDLASVRLARQSQQERVQAVCHDTAQTAAQLNEVCLHMSSTLVLLSQAISRMETAKAH